MLTIDLIDNEDSGPADDKLNKQKESAKNLTFKKSLIFQVRKHRSLYDNRHKFFSNVAKKDLVWQEIANGLKSTVDVCKDTWFELRYSYQRHARRLRNYFIQGYQENHKRPAMVLESELMFLWRFINIRKTCKTTYAIPEIIEPETIEIESDEPLSTTQNFTRTNVIENLVQSKKLNNIPANQKQIDDDIIFVEQPVELIVIDEDDDTGKSGREFKLTSTMALLISRIKNYPELYDTNHSAFRDYTRRSFIWNAIANDMGDKATKLMKCWIIMQTRYEWEICQDTQQPDNTPTTTDFQVQLGFLKNFIIKNPETVYKQSFYLKSGWYDPIDYFKDIYNLIVRMKKKAEIIHVTDSLLKSPEKSKEYLSLWEEIASLKGTSAGQCEITWLTMRYFYWELMNMRLQNYQLTDKWYFETIITELYAISKTAQAAKQQEQQVLKQNKQPKKAVKRPAQTSATSLGAPSNTRPSLPPVPVPAPTTISMNTTTTNNSQSVTGTNSTMTTQSIAATTLTLPKITAAISLAPQTLNTLQIKQIPGPPALSPAPQTLSPAPPNLSPAPQPNIISNGTPTVAAPPTSTVPIRMSMPYSLPNQTKMMPIAMPPLIRPLVQTNTLPTGINTSQTMISVQPPRAILRPALPKIQRAPAPAPWCPNSGTTVTTNSIVQPQAVPNLQTFSNFGINNSNICPPTPTTQSIVSYKVNATPSNNDPKISTIVPVPNNNVPMVTIPSAMAAAETSQLPKITGAISLLNPNEILIELIASQNGNQLVVHGPPLSTKYQLSMPMVTKFIREILSIPMLHNKRVNQPTLINIYWGHISTKFNLPVHICRACWNFLLENFNHFPQIASMKDLMKPFHSSLNVWKESQALFKNFDDHWVSKGWLKYMQLLPDVVECIGGYHALYHDVAKPNSAEKVSDMETLCAWRTIGLRFPIIPEIQEIWESLKVCFCQYMTDLEFGIDNKWPINWWRSFARLKFLVEARYSTNEPFYYIVSNKMVEEIERCAMTDMKNMYQIEKNTINPDSTDLASLNIKNKKLVEFGVLITAIQKYPDIYGKASNNAKYAAWEKVAKELRMEVHDCLLAFKQIVQMYFAYKKQDLVHRCRINERYYKKLDDIIRSLPSGKFSSKNRAKLNIKTPFELNQSLETNNIPNDTDLVFPERYISDISMANSPSNLVVKNWVFALGNISNISESSTSKLESILRKYIHT